MSYIEDNLMPNEKVLLRASIHAAAFLIPAVILMAFLCALIYWLANSNNPSWFEVIVFFILLWQIIPPLTKAVVAFVSTEFAVTNQRIIAKTGLIRRRTTEILLQKVESIKVDQGLLGRLFGYGRLEVVGTGGTSSKFIGVGNPVVFRKNINKVIEHYTGGNNKTVSG